MDWKQYYQWQEDILLKYKNNLVDNGSILWLNYPEVAAVLWNSLSKHYYPIKWITWIYHQHTGGKPLRKATRAWIWFSKSIAPYIDNTQLCGEYRNPKDKRIQERMAKGLKPVDYDWWLYEQVKNVSMEKTEHPCQLPLEMIERIVKATCPIDGTVLDMFMGSGTTAEACIKNNRNFIGIEQDDKYFGIIKNRINNLKQSYSFELSIQE